MVTLGFDSSTTVTGFAFVENKKILDCGFIDTFKIETNKDKAFFVIKQLESNPFISKVNQFNLETSLSGFMQGFSRQQVIIKLARWNAIFEYIISEHYKIPVNLVNASTARKQLFGKARIKGVKPKEYVKEQIEKMYDMQKWIKKNKLGNVDKKMADVYDAIVIANYSPIKN